MHRIDIQTKKELIDLFSLLEHRQMPNRKEAQRIEENTNRLRSKEQEAMLEVRQLLSYLALEIRISLNFDLHIISFGG